VHAVALDADAGAGLAGERAAHRHLPDLGVVGQALVDGPDVLHVEELAGLLLEVADLDVLRQAAAVEAHLEVAARAQTALGQVEGHLDVLGGAAVLLAHDDLVCDVDELPREVARVGRAERRVGPALAGAVRGDEVLEDVEALAAVRVDRQLDGFVRWVCHQVMPAGELADLLGVIRRVRLGYYVEWVEWYVFLEVLEHGVLDLFRGVVPQADDLVEAL